MIGGLRWRSKKSGWTDDCCRCTDTQQQLFTRMISPCKSVQDQRKMAAMLCWAICFSFSCFLFCFLIPAIAPEWNEIQKRTKPNLSHATDGQIIFRQLFLGNELLFCVSIAQIGWKAGSNRIIAHLTRGQPSWQAIIRQLLGPPGLSYTTAQQRRRESKSGRGGGGRWKEKEE